MPFAADVYPADPTDRFVTMVAEVLTTDYRMADEEAGRIARHVAQQYLSVEDATGDRWLWNVSLALRALSRDMVEGTPAPSADPFAGLPLIGVLRWIASQQPPAWPERPAAVDHVEAATCMALWKQEAEAHPYSADDTPAALLTRVNDLLKDTPFGTTDKERLSKAVDRLLNLRCLTSRDGWYRLKESVDYQDVDD